MAFKTSYLWALPGDGFLRNQGLKMRLSDPFPQFRTVLAIPFLAAMLAFPASAETTPNGPPAATQSGACDPCRPARMARRHHPLRIPTPRRPVPTGRRPRPVGACDPADRPEWRAGSHPRRIPTPRRPVPTGRRQPPPRALQLPRLALKPRRSPPRPPGSQMEHLTSRIRLRARRALHLRSRNPVLSSISTNRRKR